MLADPATTVKALPDKPERLLLGIDGQWAHGATVECEVKVTGYTLGALAKEITCSYQGSDWGSMELMRLNYCDFGDDFQELVMLTMEVTRSFVTERVTSVVLDDLDHSNWRP